jgi:exopolysaccharide biosynthesis operon protein EpsL
MTRRPSCRPLPYQCLLSIAVAALFAASGVARADEADTIGLNFGLSFQHDANLFRLADGVDPAPLVGNSSRSDHFVTTSLGLSFRKPFGLQQFEAGIDAISHRYDTYGFLSHDLINSRLAWRWKLTPRISGNLTSTSDQSLVGFGDFRNFGTRNLRTSQTERFDLDWLVTGGWHLLGGVDRNRTANSQVFTQDEGTRTGNADLGIRYVFPSGSWMEGKSRATAGEYLGRAANAVTQLDDGFRESRTEARLHWLLGGKTTLDGGLGIVARDHEHFTSRDYRGVIGDIAVVWLPNGKLSLNLAWKRNLAAFTDFTSSYSVSNTWSLSPGWQWSPKLRFGLSLNRDYRDYRGAIVALPGPAREDRLDTARLTVDWTPYRAVSLNGFVAAEQRRSNQPGLGYGTRLLGANLRLSF